MKDINYEEFITNKGGAIRFNQGKLRYDLVDPHAHKDFVQVLTDGANKYFPRNWENGLSWTSVLASLKRHISAFEMGEDYDPESGRLHIAHAACNVHFLNAFYYIFPQGDDRPKKYFKLPKIGLDIDGVLADFIGSWSKLYSDVSPNPTTYYCDRNILKRFDEMKLNKTLNDFYLNLKPLVNPNDLKFDPFCYITSRPVSKEITEMWLDFHKFPAREVISLDIRESKVDAAKKMNLDIFVDDMFENFTELNNAGIFTYLYSASWNLKYGNLGHMRINSLNDIKFFE